MNSKKPAAPASTGGMIRLAALKPAWALVCLMLTLVSSNGREFPRARLTKGKGETLNHESSKTFRKRLGICVLGGPIRAM